MARQGRKGGGSHGLIASLWSSVQKRSYFSLSDRRAFFMFFPEELITYAVYSNPADFCQGKKTPERWLRLVLFREGGCLVKNGSKALKPRPWLLQGPLDLIGCACVGEHWGGRGKKALLCTHYGPPREKNSKYIRRGVLAHMHMHTFTIYTGALCIWAYMQKHSFCCLITLQLVKICPIWACAEFENRRLGVNLEQPHSNRMLKNSQLPATSCMSGLTQKRNRQYQLRGSCSDADSAATLSCSGAK